MFIVRLIQALNQFQVDYALVGGYAVALHGAVRGTVDIDLVISLTEAGFTSAEEAFQSLGLKPKLPVSGQQVFQFRKEYIENRNLVAWSFYHPSKPIEIVDVIITHDVKAFHIDRIQFKNLQIHVASIKDLIQMKKKSGRPQDLEDIKALEILTHEKRKRR